MWRKRDRDKERETAREADRQGDRDIEKTQKQIYVISLTSLMSKWLKERLRIHNYTFMNCSGSMRR